VAAAGCGWSVNDVLSSTEERSPVIFETITTVQRSDDYNAEVRFENPQAAQNFVSEIQHSVASEAMQQPPVANGDSVELRFNEVNDVEIQQIEKSRWSSCLRTQELGELPNLEKNTKS